MAWSDLVNIVDSACLAAFGVPATFTPQDGSGAQQITGIIRTPAMGEDAIPGGIQGVSVVRFFVQFSTIAPAPQHGDTVTINAITYVVAEVDVDVHGDAVLKLRAE
jgi:hypothetical protein